MGQLAGIIVKKERPWKRWEFWRAELKFHDHQGCPGHPVEGQLLAKSWNRIGGMHKAIHALHKVELTAHQRAASEALGG